MSSRQYLRHLITERLTAAAEEIFSIFEQNIVEYEEEVNRQRKLLEIFCNPRVELRRIELPQQHVWKEEAVLTEQQLWNQERNSSLDQEEPQSLQVKEEQEETCTSHEGDQLEVKQEADIIMLTLGHEESDHMEPEPDSDQQLLSHSSPVAESPGPTGSDHVDSVSNRNAETETHTGKPFSYNCGFCGRGFPYRSQFVAHTRVHTGDKPFSCRACEKSFKTKQELRSHLRNHTGEKPYMCTICGSSYMRKDDLILHMRTHTGENPFYCAACGKCFPGTVDLKSHKKTHTGEMPLICNVCKNSFNSKQSLDIHTRTHTGERPYSCETCGERFVHGLALKKHKTTHTG
ncbi:gastrula zinc finger protein XlCGF52.1-like [Solea solea]|uniref:gastrula zinc finger protein XlCGF52.1-like n=1 Tax=Solea solea TaxID=90069 RepID=UPI00272A1E1C|nr:gastrula zinc finger protein XlCGF52.1-like [Solea solea]